MRFGWLLVMAVGGLSLSPVARAEVQGGNADNGLTNAAAPLPFGLPISPPIIDPWSLGGPSCVPIGSGPLLPSAPARPRRVHPRAASATLPDTPTAAEPACVPEPPARTIAMAAGPAVFNVLTAGARPNSSVTLRIDNRTTVTITVNAEPTACPAAIPAAGPEPPGGVPVAPPAISPPLQNGTASGIFEVPSWAALWAGGRVSHNRGGALGHEFLGSLDHSNEHSFPGRERAERDGRGKERGHEGGGGGSDGGQGVVWEPSTLLLLGSGVTGLVFLARRRR